MKKLSINKTSKILNALKKIERNKLNFLAVIDGNQKLIGTITEGDIRRYILAGGSYTDQIDKCYNKNFSFVFEKDSNQEILIKFDQKIKFLPIVNHKMTLLKIMTKDQISLIQNKKFSFSSRCPARISFAGGGTDVSSYFNNNFAAVINTTISLYTYCELIIRDDDKINILSNDLKSKIRTNIKELNSKIYSKKFDLLINTLKTINPSFGFDLFIRSDIPIGSGLGGSSSMINSILGVFNEACNKHWSKKEISEFSFMIERFKTGISGGWQDQYSTVHGGFNYLELEKKVFINSLRIKQDVICELEKKLFLAHLNFNHNSSEILKDQISNSKKSKFKKLLMDNAENAKNMKDCLIDFNFKRFNYLLNKSWEIKRKLSQKISSKKIDNLYKNSTKSGVLSGKILGAGAGGFFLFSVDEKKIENFFKFASDNNLKLTKVRFDEAGLVVWKSDIN